MFLWLQKKIKKVVTPSPKYRLVPDNKGTYTLEKWNPNMHDYICESVSIKTPEEADQIIKNLERKVIYYRESNN